MKNINFSIDKNKCISCNACVKDCPRDIIKNPDGRIPGIPPELAADCLECQHCLAVCPTAAISILGVSPDDCLPLTIGTLPTLAQETRLLRGRRSVRQFLRQNVNPGQIQELLATVANSPTGCNDRALRFTVIDDLAVMQRLLVRLVNLLEVELNQGRLDAESFLAEAVTAYRKDGTDNFFRGAPHALIVSAGPAATCPVEDANIALAYFELLSQSAGLGTLWCGMLKFALDAAPELKKLLKLDGEQYFYTVLFGIPAVHYARTVQRDNAAEVRRIAIDEL